MVLPLWFIFSTVNDVPKRNVVMDHQTEWIGVSSYVCRSVFIYATNVRRYRYHIGKALSDSIRWVDSSNMHNDFVDGLERNHLP